MFAAMKRYRGAAGLQTLTSKALRAKGGYRSQLTPTTPLHLVYLADDVDLAGLQPSAALFGAAVRYLDDEAGVELGQCVECQRLAKAAV